MPGAGLVLRECLLRSPRLRHGYERGVCCDYVMCCAMSQYAIESRLPSLFCCRVRLPMLSEAKAHLRTCCNRLGAAELQALVRHLGGAPSAQLDRVPWGA